MLRLMVAFLTGVLVALWLSWSPPVSANPCSSNPVPPDLPSSWIPQMFSEVTSVPKPYVPYPLPYTPHSRPDY